MRFWDSSALLPLFVEEPTSAAVRELYGGGDGILAWWGTPVECASGFARAARQGLLDAAGLTELFRRLDVHRLRWQTVEPAEEIRESARRFVRVHPLRAADALQLAAAYTAAERRPPALELVTLDDRLRDAALREGFIVLAL